MAEKAPDKISSPSPDAPEQLPERRDSHLSNGEGQGADSGASSSGPETTAGAAPNDGPNDGEDDEIIAGPAVILLADEGWARHGLPALAEEATRAALRHLGLPPDRFTLTILATDDATIRDLNARFRGKDKPTNVLSWPAVDLSPQQPGAAPAPLAPGTEDEPAFLGDLALARETCEREAEETGRPVTDHLRHLVIHGLLHLLGYDHETEEDAARMEGLEREILASIGIPDPYAESETTAEASAPGDGDEEEGAA